MDGVFCCKPSPAACDSAPVPQTDAFCDQLTQLSDKLRSAPPDILVIHVELVRDVSRALGKGGFGGFHDVKRSVWDRSRVCLVDQCTWSDS